MTTLVLLHGFLGSPNDWNFLLKAFPQHTFVRHDLFAKQGIFPSLGLLRTGSAINALASAQKRPKILIGYSLGARIALHALVDRPDLWNAAVLISAHPGLDSEYARKERLINDEKWAERFLCEHWDSLLAAWNSQPVFSTKGLPRSEKEYSRETLAEALTGWSLGKQKDLRSEIAKLDLPLLWITGEEDIKFTTIAKNVKLSHPLSRQKVISKAGHRAPWENEPEFTTELNSFINTINQRMDHAGRNNRCVARDQDV